MTDIRIPSAQEIRDAEIRAHELRALALKSFFVAARARLGAIFSGVGRHAHS